VEPGRVLKVANVGVYLVMIVVVDVVLDGNGDVDGDDLP
jgi:hypothetical protein